MENYSVPTNARSVHTMIVYYHLILKPCASASGTNQEWRRKPIPHIFARQGGGVKKYVIIEAML